jgi:hypothetical protein
MSGKRGMASSGPKRKRGIDSMNQVGRKIVHRREEDMSAASASALRRITHQLRAAFGNLERGQAQHAPHARSLPDSDHVKRSVTVGIERLIRRIGGCGLR